MVNYIDKISREVKKANILLHKEEAKIYNGIHKEIFNPIEQKMIMIRLLRAIKINNIQLCLDLGCGTGNLTIKESSIFNKVIGLDISKEMIEILMEKTPDNDRIELILADCENIPFKDNCINFLSMFSVLHHLPNFEKGLRESFRVLMDDGIIFIDHEPNYRNLMKKLRKVIFKMMFSMRIRNHSFFINLDYSKADIHAKRGFNRKVIGKILANIGFSNITINFHYRLPYLPLNFTHFFYIKFWEFLDKFPLTKKFADFLTITALARKR